MVVEPEYGAGLDHKRRSICSNTRLDVFQVRSRSPGWGCVSVKGRLRTLLARTPGCFSSTSGKSPLRDSHKGAKIKQIGRFVVFCTEDVNSVGRAKAADGRSRFYPSIKQQNQRGGSSKLGRISGPREAAASPPLMDAALKQHQPLVSDPLHARLLSPSGMRQDSGVLPRTDSEELRE